VKVVEGTCGCDAIALSAVENNYLSRCLNILLQCMKNLLAIYCIRIFFERAMPTLGCLIAVALCPTTYKIQSSTLIACYSVTCAQQTTVPIICGTVHQYRDVVLT
jgi:hypothetical protein